MNKLRWLLPLALAACAPGQTVEGRVSNSVTGGGIADVAVAAR